MAKLKPEQIEKFYAALAKANPDPRGELDYINPYTLLVAVVLAIVGVYGVVAYSVAERRRELADFLDEIRKRSRPPAGAVDASVALGDVALERRDREGSGV